MINLAVAVGTLLLVAIAFAVIRPVGDHLPARPPTSIEPPPTGLPRLRDVLRVAGVTGNTVLQGAPGPFLYDDLITGEQLRIDFPNLACYLDFQDSIARCADLISRVERHYDRERFALRLALLNPLVYGWNRMWTPPRPADDHPWVYPEPDADGRSPLPSEPAAVERIVTVMRHHSGTLLIEGHAALSRLASEGRLVRVEPPINELGWQKVQLSDQAVEWMNGIWWFRAN